MKGGRAFDKDEAHASTIALVVRVLAALAVGLYAAIVGLLIAGVEVPGELYQSAASAAGVLGGLPVSTKAGGSGGTQVTAQSGATVEVGDDASDLAAMPTDRTGAGDIPPDDPAAVQNDADDPDTPAVEPPTHGGEHDPADEKDPGAPAL